MTNDIRKILDVKEVQQSAQFSTKLHVQQPKFKDLPKNPFQLQKFRFQYPTVMDVPVVDEEKLII